MIYRYRVRRTIITVLLFYLFSLIIGKFIISPLLGSPLNNLFSFITGAAVISMGVHVYFFVFALWANTQMGKQIRMCFPKNAREMREMGVETPIDFAYAVSHILSYVPVPFFGNMIPRPRVRYDRKIYANSKAMFREMFGRDPMAYGTKDWEYISFCETADLLNVDIGAVSYEMLEENVSDPVKRFIHEKRYFKSLAVE